LGATVVGLILIWTHRCWLGAVRNPSPPGLIIAVFAAAVIIRYAYLRVTLPGEVAPPVSSPELFLVQPPISHWDKPDLTGRPEETHVVWPGNDPNFGNVAVGGDSQHPARRPVVDE
jgi:hypothetical protein